MTRTSSIAVAIMLGGIAFGLVTPAASAAPRIVPEDAVAQRASLALRSTSRAQVGKAASVAPTKGGKATIDLTTDGTRTTVPSQPSDPVRITSKTRSGFGFLLPFSDRASAAKTVSEGIVVYDNHNGSLTAPIVLSDGSVQINTIITSADAPRYYDYTLDLPAGSKAKDVGGGLWFSVGSQSIGGVAPAWATDSNGRSVPTRYVFDRGTLTQVIEHSNAYAYPIVGDPWMFINLFSSITVDSYNSQPRVNLNLSWWGWAVYTGVAQGVYGAAAGQIILNTAGWDEAWNKNSTVRSALNKTSQRQQFECHALGALFAGTWNLEKFRPTLTVHWTSNLANHRCNWITSTGGV